MTEEIIIAGFGASYRLDFHEDKKIDNGVNAKKESKRQAKRNKKKKKKTNDFDS